MAEKNNIAQSCQVKIQNGTNNDSMPEAGSCITERYIKRQSLTTLFKQLAGWLKEPGIILCVVVCFFCLAQLWSTVRNNTGTDFYIPWVISQDISQGEPGNIYSENVRTELAVSYWRKAQEQVGKDTWRVKQVSNNWRKIIAPATPFHYAAFSPFVTGDYSRDYFLYQFSCLLFSIVAILYFCRLLEYSNIVSLVALIVFLDWFAPYMSDVRVANVNRLLLVVIILYAAFLYKAKGRIRHILAGSVLGFLLFFKPIIIFGVLLLFAIKLLTHRFNEALYEGIGFATSAVLSIAISGFFFGSLRPWDAWLRQLSGLSGKNYGISHGNYSANLLLEQWFSIDLNHFLVGFIGVGGVLVLLILVRMLVPAEPSPNSNPEKHFFLLDILALSMGLLIFLLCSKLVWLHYYVLTIPIILILLRPSPTGQSLYSDMIKHLLTGGAIVCIALKPIIYFFEINDPEVMASWVVLGTIILFILAVWEFMTRGRIIFD